MNVLCTPAIYDFHKIWYDLYKLKKGLEFVPNVL